VVDFIIAAKATQAMRNRVAPQVPQTGRPITPGTGSGPVIRPGPNSPVPGPPGAPPAAGGSSVNLGGNQPPSPPGSTGDYFPPASSSGSSVNLGGSPAAAAGDPGATVPPSMNVQPGMPLGSSGGPSMHAPPPGSTWTPGPVPRPGGGNPVYTMTPEYWAEQYPGDPYPPQWQPGPMGHHGNAWDPPW
jgi:hypothetical protein